MRQQNAVAPSSAGWPPGVSAESMPAKRSPMLVVASGEALSYGGVPIVPERSGRRAGCSLPFWPRGCLTRRHTSTEGGSADTDAKALTVAPCRPACPLVVTTDTLHATLRIAAINCCRDISGCKTAQPHGDCSRVQKLYSRRRLIQIQHYEKRKFLAFKFNLIAFKMTP
jgi:hypothetical protein